MNVIKIKHLAVIFLMLVNTAIGQAKDYPRTSPSEDGKPTQILISFYVLDIEEINSKEQSFTVDFFIRLKWKDPRISGENGPIPLDAIWHPNIQIFNLRDVETRSPESVTILDDGTVQYIQRYYSKLGCHLNFKDFPFDIQTLPVSLVAFTPDPVELIFENAGSEKKYSISDWNIEPAGAKNLEVRANLFDEASETIIRQRLDYEFVSTRFIQYYWWSVLAPLMVILFLSWAVFWIDPSQVGAQVGVSGTSILTLIAFLYKLGNILPPVSYLTHMDHFIFSALILVFVAYLEALISTTFAYKGKKEFAIKLDIIFRIGYPILFLILIIIFWFN